MPGGPKLHIHRSEQDRVRRIVTGSDAAFRELVDEFRPLAYSLAYRTLGDCEDAEEVVQDAFVKVHEALPGFRGESSLQTWILRIVWRLSLNRRRDRARGAWRRLGLHRAAEEPAAVAGERGAVEGPEAGLQSRETLRVVRELIDRLPPPLREVMILNGFEELGYQEIARVLDVPVGTVSSRIHNARRRLGAALRARGLV